MSTNLRIFSKTTGRISGYAHHDATPNAGGARWRSGLRAGFLLGRLRVRSRTLSCVGHPMLSPPPRWMGSQMAVTIPREALFSSRYSGKQTNKRFAFDRKENRRWKRAVSIKFERMPTIHDKLDRGRVVGLVFFTFFLLISPSNRFRFFFPFLQSVQMSSQNVKIRAEM